MCQTEAARRAPDRHAMDRHLMRLSDLQYQIIQRQIRLGSHPRRNPVLQTAQLAMPAAITLPARLQRGVNALAQHT